MEGFWRGQNRGRGGAILTPNELVLIFGGSYICANFGENRSRNATLSVHGRTHKYTDRLTDKRKPTLQSHHHVRVASEGHCVTTVEVAEVLSGGFVDILLRPYTHLWIPDRDCSYF